MNLTGRKIIQLSILPLIIIVLTGCVRGSPELRLRTAIEDSDARKVRILLRQGINPNTRYRAHGDLSFQNTRLTALQVAVNLAEKPTEVVQALLDGGADVDLRDADGRTVLHTAVYRGVSSPAEMETFEMLCKLSTDIDAKSNAGETSLGCCARFRRYEMAEHLLSLGADPNLQMDNDETAAHKAAISGSVDILRLLRLKGADFRVKDDKGDTVLDVMKWEGITLD